MARDDDIIPRPRDSPKDRTSSAMDSTMDDRDHRDAGRSRGDRSREDTHYRSSSHNETLKAAGFPDNYQFRKGDWLCPSPGCEGFVTSNAHRHCINCGRYQPHVHMLMELAQNANFRTEPCSKPQCPMRTCSLAHSPGEVRDYWKTRVYRQRPESSPPPVPTPTMSEITEFAERWKLTEPAIYVLTRSPGPLSDILMRTFTVPASTTDAQASVELCRIATEYLRPPSFMVNTAVQFHAALQSVLQLSSAPVGIACSGDGHFALTQEKDVLLMKLGSWSSEDLGLLALAISYTGCGVVHSSEDRLNLKSLFPRRYSDLFDRVRVVDRATEIAHIANDNWDRVTDRASQAKVDAMTPPITMQPVTPVAASVAGGLLPSPA